MLSWSRDTNPATSCFTGAREKLHCHDRSAVFVRQIMKFTAFGRHYVPLQNRLRANRFSDTILTFQNPFGKINILAGLKHIKAYGIFPASHWPRNLNFPWNCVFRFDKNTTSYGPNILRGHHETTGPSQDGTARRHYAVLSSFRGTGSRPINNREKVLSRLHGTAHLVFTGQPISSGRGSLSCCPCDIAHRKYVRAVYRRQYNIDQYLGKSQY